MAEYLKLANICKSYGEKKAVDDLSLTVPKGAIYGIIGPNGAGKTTTIRMIMNIIAPDSGELLINGQKATAEFRNRVGYLPEERGLYKKMSINEIIIFLAELKGFPGKKAAEVMDKWLEKMSLAEYKNKKVEELSKGMQQKLQFITTLIHQPELIILDELFSGLDPLNIELIKNILLDEKRLGTTILFSTHVMEQAEKLCDFICLINGGRKVLDGRLTEVKSKFGTNTIQIDMEGDGSFIKDIPGVKAVTSDNNYMELELLADADSQTILKQVSEKVTVRRFEIMEPSLYKIFIDVAGVKPTGMARGGEANV
jgi:ABC-2 type transport system ATP-binding protein